MGSLKNESGRDRRGLYISVYLMSNVNDFFMCSRWTLPVESGKYLFLSVSSSFVSLFFVKFNFTFLIVCYID